MALLNLRRTLVKRPRLLQDFRFGTRMDVLQEWGLLSTAAAHAGRPHAHIPSPATVQGIEARNGTTQQPR